MEVIFLFLIKQWPPYHLESSRSGLFSPALNTAPDSSADSRGCVNPSDASFTGNWAGNFLSSDIYLVWREPVYFLLLRALGGIAGVWDEVFPYDGICIWARWWHYQGEGNMPKATTSQWMSSRCLSPSIQDVFPVCRVTAYLLIRSQNREMSEPEEIQGWSIPVLSFHSWEDWSLGKGKTFPKWFQGRTKVRIQIFPRVGRSVLLIKSPWKVNGGHFPLSNQAVASISSGIF